MAGKDAGDGSWIRKNQPVAENAMEAQTKAQRSGRRVSAAGMPCGPMNRGKNRPGDDVKLRGSYKVGTGKMVQWPVEDYDMIDIFLVPRSLFAVLVAAVSATAISAQQPHPEVTGPTLKTLLSEAETLQQQSPEEWQQRQEKLDGVFRDHVALVAQWRARGTPPAPDVASLDLPLPLLVHQLLCDEKLLELAAAKRPRLVQYNQGQWRQLGCAEAIVASGDERRTYVLLDYRDRELRAGGRTWSSRGLWNKRIAEAATPAWAARKIVELIEEEPRPTLAELEHSLFFRLVERFAGELPDWVGKIAYPLLADYSVAPQDHFGEKLWDVLLRFDPARARREIIPHLLPPGDSGPNILVVNLLVRHAGPSPELAEAVRKCLTTNNDLPEFYRAPLQGVLVQAAPKDEWNSAVQRIDRWLAGQQGREVAERPDEAILWLLGALNAVELDDVVPHLERYAFERALPDGLRLNVLLSLAGRRHPRCAELVARWLPQEISSMRRYLRKRMVDDHGDYGKKTIAEVDRLMAKTP